MRIVLAQVFRWLTIGSISWLIVSCTTYRTLQIEVMAPATIPLNTENKIAYLDRNVVYRSDSIFILNDYKDFSHNKLADLFCHGVKRCFTNNERTEDILPLRSRGFLFTKENQKPAPLEVDEIKEICDSFHVEYIISLEYHRFVTNVKKRNFYPEWFIRLYSSTSPTPIDSAFYKGWTLDARASNIDYFTINVRNDAENTGSQYAERLIPHWTSTTRRIYNSGEVLGLGDVCFQNENTEEALKIWKAATKLSLKLALKAAINVAWIYENKGDFEMAVNVLKEVKQKADKKSMNNKTLRYLNEYLKILEKRIKDNEQLNKQL